MFEELDYDPAINEAIEILDRMNKLYSFIRTAFTDPELQDYLISNLQKGYDDLRVKIEKQALVNMKAEKEFADEALPSGSEE